MSANLEYVELPLGQGLYAGGDKIEYVYFPLNGLVSLVAHVGNRVPIEVGVIGKDGIVGIPIVLGDDIAFEHAIVQIAGDAMRMKSSELRKEIKSGESQLLAHALLFIRQLMKQVAQTAACNRLHNIEQRLSRWLLMCRDRMESNELVLTQEFISNMLGTRRAGVSNAAGKLQRSGLISYSRGNITILDSQLLEEFTCECYGAVNGVGKLGRRK